MVCPWAYGGFEGWHVDRWLSSRAGLSADVLRGGTGRLRRKWIDSKTRIRRKEGILRNKIPILQCDTSLSVKRSNYRQIVTGESIS